MPAFQDPHRTLHTPNHVRSPSKVACSLTTQPLHRSPPETHLHRSLCGQAPAVAVHASSRVPTTLWPHNESRSSHCFLQDMYLTGTNPTVTATLLCACGAKRLWLSVRATLCCAQLQLLPSACLLAAAVSFAASARLSGAGRSQSSCNKAVAAKGAAGIAHRHRQRPAVMV